MSDVQNSLFIDVRLRRIRLARAGRAVLRDIDWRIQPGQRWILAGGNGAGKTQLLKLVTGAVWPTPDGIGTRRYTWRKALWATPREVQDEIAYLGAERQDKYERYGWNHTVRQVIGTGIHRTDIPLHELNAAQCKRVQHLLQELAIEALAERSFLSLSYGERRLVLLARALATQPGLLLLDELLNGLDEANREQALRWLERSARAMLPWVLATHRLEDVPPSATHALVLERGRIVYRGQIARAPLRRWLEGGGHAQRKRQARARTCLHQPIVRLRSASVYLDERAVLFHISLAIRPGECWLVHGANGSGKTTLLRTLYGDYGVAVGGSVERAGIEPGVPLESFRRKVGLVAPHLQAEHPQDLTVTETVLSGCLAAIGVTESASTAQRSAVQRTLAQFGLARLGKRILRELSYGQLRRVLFARAWVNHPRLLLLDEPFAGIDAPTRRGLQHIIDLLLARGAAVVMATHHRPEWPPGTTHELALVAGRAHYCGPVREGANLAHSHATRAARKPGASASCQK